VRENIVVEAEISSWRPKYDPRRERKPFGRKGFLLQPFSPVITCVPDEKEDRVMSATMREIAEVLRKAANEQKHQRAAVLWYVDYEFRIEESPCAARHDRDVRTRRQERLGVVIVSGPTVEDVQADLHEHERIGKAQEGGEGGRSVNVRLRLLQITRYADVHVLGACLRGKGGDDAR
jgi:hypothetical protein